MDKELIRLALRPHVPMIKFRWAKNGHKQQQSMSTAKKMWYQEFSKRPVLTEQEIASINVLTIILRYLMFATFRMEVPKKMFKTIKM